MGACDGDNAMRVAEDDDATDSCHERRVPADAVPVYQQNVDAEAVHERHARSIVRGSRSGAEQLRLACEQQCGSKQPVFIAVAM